MTLSMDKLTEEQLEEIRKSKSVRKKLAFDSHLYFFSIYLSHYIKYPFAPFHYEIFRFTENENMHFIILISFRDSGKSTICTTSFPIWAVTGRLKKKFIIIVSSTRVQSKKHLANIRQELENNELLRNDIGPFKEESNEWTSDTLVLLKYGVRIMAVSAEQSIRGLRHGQYRPDLIICDDVEDSISVNSKELRDKVWDWFNSEIIPIGSSESKILVVGNLLHEDSLIRRLKRSIEEERLNANYFEYPLLNDSQEIAWLGKFQTYTDIEKLMNSIPSKKAWNMEYLLKNFSDEGSVIQSEWIHFYDTLPSYDSENFIGIFTAIDPAVSTEESADCTAIVSGAVFCSGDDIVVYILPEIINKRMTFPDVLDTLIVISKSMGSDIDHKICVEEVGIQKALVQLLNSKGINAEGVKVHSMDKRARLAMVTPLLQKERALFPRKGGEELILQLTGFGVEKHDDLADAFSILLRKVIESFENGKPQMYILEV